MSFKKSFYEQFGNEIEEEVKLYKAKQEKKEVKFNKCPHKEAKYNGKELRCKCGASWSGANLHKLYSLLTSEK